MSYRVVQNKKYPHRFRVLWRKYTKDVESGEYVAKDRHIPSTEYGTIGITKEMSLEQIKSILKKINIEEDRKQREARRNAIAIRIVEEREIECIHLPKPLLHRLGRFET